VAHRPDRGRGRPEPLAARDERGRARDGAFLIGESLVPAADLLGPGVTLDEVYADAHQANLEWAWDEV